MLRSDLQWHRFFNTHLLKKTKAEVKKNMYPPQLQEQDQAFQDIITKLFTQDRKAK